MTVLSAAQHGNSKEIYSVVASTIEKGLEAKC